MTLTETRAMPADIGIDEGDRREVADALSRLLADSYTVYLKTHNFHWNVTSSMFQSLHLMFEADAEIAPNAHERTSMSLVLSGSFVEEAGTARDVARSTTVLAFGSFPTRIRGTDRYLCQSAQP
jgi:hypothetical protein